MNDFITGVGDVLLKAQTPHYISFYRDEANKFRFLLRKQDITYEEFMGLIEKILAHTN